MKKWLVFMMVLAVLALVGCHQEEAISAVATTLPSVPTVAPTVPQPPTEVSPLTVEDFLIFEDSSSFREEKVELVMIHFTSAVMLDRENPYDYDLVRGIFVENRLGIHYLIDRDGTIYCFLPESRAAWHAGKGSYGDEKYTDKMNQYSVGIELMGIGSQEDMSIYLHPEEYGQLRDDLIGFTDAQYAALAALVQDICQRNDLPAEREYIIGHQAYNPAKNDPGELFDWDRLMGLLTGK